jgi:hypothetical protein
MKKCIIIQNKQCVRTSENHKRAFSDEVIMNELADDTYGLY